MRPLKIKINKLSTRHQNSKNESFIEMNYVKPVLAAKAKTLASWCPHLHPGVHMFISLTL